MAERYMVSQYGAGETLPSAAAFDDGFVVLHGGVFKRVIDGAWEEVAAGPQGDDGDNGAPGVDGSDGAPGADGVDGAPGVDGVDGVDGAPGADGGGITSFRGTWDTGGTYTTGDVVQFDIDLYQATDDNTATEPNPDPTPVSIGEISGASPAATTATAIGQGFSFAVDTVLDGVALYVGGGVAGTVAVEIAIGYDGARTTLTTALVDYDGGTAGWQPIVFSSPLTLTGADTYHLLTGAGTADRAYLFTGTTDSGDVTRVGGLRYGTDFVSAESTLSLMAQFLSAESSLWSRVYVGYRP